MQPAHSAAKSRIDPPPYSCEGDGWIYELFVELAGLDPEERARRLERTGSRGDGSLRVVTELLRAADRSADVLRDIDRLFATSGREETEDSLVGCELSHYRILEPMGGGGMGVVYRAFDTRLDRIVALKFLPPWVRGGSAAGDRLLREARAASAVDHPNIGTIHDVLYTPDDRTCIAMALYEGRTLAEILQDGPLALDRVCDIGVQVARGLAAAHARGIVHCDVKPGNILVRDDGVVKLLDFGLARFVNRDRPADALPRGTPPYMAPEQIGGGPVTPAVDVWALGVTLYEMSTGRRPFDASAPDALIEAIRAAAPVPPSSLVPGLPPWFDRIIEQSLRKEPGGRRPQARHVRRILEEGRTSLSAPDGARRPPLPIPASGVAAVVALLLLGVAAAMAMSGILPDRGVNEVRDTVGQEARALGFDPRSSRVDVRRRIAVLPLEDLTEDPGSEHVVAGLHEAIVFGLGGIRALETISRSSVLRYANERPPAPQLGRELGIGSMLEGSVTRQGDSVRIALRLIDVGRDAQVWTGRFEGDLSDLLRLQDQIARAVARQLRAHLTPREDVLLAGSPRIDPRAGEAYLQARNTPDEDQAIAGFEEAVRIDPDFAAPYGELARLYGMKAFRGGYGSTTPVELYDRVELLASRALQLDSTLASAYTALAEVRYHRDWDWDAGLRLFRRALDLNPSYSTALMRMSGHLSAVGQVEAGIAAARRAQAVNPRSAFPWSGMAYNLAHVGRFEQALRGAEIALRIDPADPLALEARGRALTALGQYDAGLADLAASGDSAELVIGLARVGRMDQAIALRDSLSEAAGAVRTPPFDLARMYAVTGETDRAIDWLARAEEERAGTLMWLNVSPELAELRRQPAVRALLKRMRFPTRPDPDQRQS